MAEDAERSSPYVSFITDLYTYTSVKNLTLQVFFFFFYKFY